MSKMKPRANFPNHSKGCSENCSYHLYFHPASPDSSLSQESGVGNFSSLLKVLVCLTEAVFSSSFIALGDVPFLTVKCIDFVEYEYVSRDVTFVYYV